LGAGELEVKTCALAPEGSKNQAISSEAKAEDAVSLKLISNQLSLISVPNTIAKLGLIRDEGRHSNGVAVPPSYPTRPSIVMTFASVIGEGLLLEGFMLTASVR
jgi:hypothetical protein